MDGLTGSALTYVRALLGTHAARLGASLRERDRGASAVELAVITALIIVVAVAVVGAITLFVKKEDKKITSGK